MLRTALRLSRGERRRGLLSSLARLALSCTLVLATHSPDSSRLAMSIEAETAPPPPSLHRDGLPKVAHLPPDQRKAPVDIIDDASPLTRPLYIPAILKNPTNKHLASALAKKPKSADDKGPKLKASGNARGGKRGQLRWENAQLAHHPSLHRPSRSDFSPGPNLKAAIPVFAPPPASFSRSTYSSPAASSSATGAASAEAGQYSMSLRGLRKNLRAAVGGRTEVVLEIMETELRAWLTLSGRIPEGFYHDSTGGKLLDPTPLDDFPLPSLPDLPDLPSSSSSSKPVYPPTLTELTRQPHSLTWLAPSPHTRYLLHSLVRYYHLQSFSRPLSPLDPDVRVTHILRPQIARPRPPAGGLSRLGGGLETPDATDLSSVGGGTTTEGEDFTSDGLAAGESSAYETDTDGSVAGWESVSRDASLARGAEGYATESDSARYSSETDGAEAVYSTESDSASAGEGEEGSEYDSADDGGVDSLSSSLAALPAPSAGTPPRPSHFVASPSGTSTPSPAPFISLAASPSGATPVPSFRLSPLSPGGDATPTRTARTAERTRGRRHLAANNGYASAETSPSRSRTRPAVQEVVQEEWKMPERSFLEWVLR